MVLLLRADADRPALERALKRLGIWSGYLTDEGEGARAITLDASSRLVDESILGQLPGVESVLRGTSPHPLLDAQGGKAITITPSLQIGGDAPRVLAAGPCAAESPEQVRRTAALVRKSGGVLLRGGAFKPRTSPYAFNGHGQEALTWLRQAADEFGLALVTEVMSEGDVGKVAEVADLMQIGSRNMQNFSLLAKVGGTHKPVLLKRGRAASLKEWRLAAEHCLKAGASGVIFCERGILSSDPETRNLLDLAGATLLSTVYQQPVLVDPSHGTGRRDLVIPMGFAALAAGCSGLLVECHPDAGEACSDAAQALSPTEMGRLGSGMAKLLASRGAWDPSEPQEGSLGGGHD